MKDTSKSDLQKRIDKLEKENKSLKEKLLPIEEKDKGKKEQISLRPSFFKGIFEYNVDYTEKTRDEEITLSAFIKNLPGIAYSCKNDGLWTMKYVSPAIKELTGYTFDDLVDNNTIAYVELIHKDDREKVYNVIQDSVKNKTNFTVTYRIIDATGNLKWVWEQGQGIYESEREGTLLEGFITDITESKRQEKKIEEQAVKIDAILKAMPDMLFIFDKEGNYIDVYADTDNILALSREEIIGTNLKDIFSKKETERFLKVFRSCLKAGGIQTLEYQLIINNKLMFFEARISALNKEHVLSIARNVTDSKKAEEAIWQAEENFRNTLDESPLGMRIVTIDGKTLYANQAMLDIYGYNNTKELFNIPIKKRYTPGSYVEFLARQKKRKEGKIGPTEYEVSIIRKDGEIRHLVAYRKKVLWDGNDEYLVIYRDITEQKNALNALRDSEERFKSLYQNSSLGLYRTTPDGQILLANPVVVNMLGYNSFEDLARINLYDKKHFSKNTPREKFIRDIEKKKEVKGYESQWVRKDGKIIHVRENAKAIKDKYGKTICYDGTVEDITKQQLAERALHESEQRFRNLVENAFNGIYIIKKDSYEYVNDKFCEITGYKREELMSTDIALLLTGDEVDAQKKREQQKPTIIETQLKTKSGEIKDIELMKMNMDTSSKPRVLGLVRDITERKQSQKLKQEVTVAKRSLEFKRNFLANMSHEIRTPLTGIIGITNILDKSELTPYQKEYLNSLRHSTENLNELIDQILDYSKIQAGEMKLKPKVFSISSIFENSEKFFESVCNKEIDFETYMSYDLPKYVKADDRRILQIIYNLIGNAVKFTDKGRIVLRVKSEKSFDKDNSNSCLIKIEVEDTGVGIRPEVQEILFKPFSQVEQADNRNFEGTGLGLSICKDLSEMLGGKIDLKSESGKGTLFWFTFRAQMAVKKDEKLHKKEGDNNIYSPLKILFVEDKELNQKVISLMLKSIGHEVTVANNGKEALNIFSPEEFDLILMDIQMPVMDGITATKLLKEKYDNCPPVVGLSANAFEGDRIKYMQQGMDDYITKPLKENDLNEVIERLFYS